MTKDSSHEDDDELRQIWNLFKEAPENIQERRQKITQLIHENNISSFPDSLSVFSALDELIGCFSLGGQLKSYYRYGSYDNCARQREKFWFAVKNGALYQLDTDVGKLSEAEINKRKKIQDFYKRRLIEDKAKGSSEDVWDIRQTLLNRPFNGHQESQGKHSPSSLTS
ncbi:uncharacterized protein PRCAT00000254001 [Priceomyces carsonii]|uniref:uncharacterized protein n=1 Tax=Priceomyces carsonii TaxID=28549 RepID=UPI002ED7A645|nr:unnamed protein product [Priceomyces carsonii]